MTLFFLFIIGLAVGSFLNVVIDRLPKNESIWKNRSHCDHCGHILFWYDLVPIFSFFWLGRKCRYCHKNISWQYPIVELTTALLFLFSYTSIIQIIEVVNLFHFLYYLIIISGLIVIFFTDLKYRIIPDQILAVLAISTVVFLLIFDKGGVLDHFLAGLISFFLFLLLVIATRGKGMGLGDVKYAAVSGFILGVPQSIVSFYLSFLTGAAVSLILILMGKKTVRSTIPFGPFLAGGTLVSLFYGQSLWEIFRKMIGI